MQLAWDTTAPCFGQKKARGQAPGFCVRDTRLELHSWRGLRSLAGLEIRVVWLEAGHSRPDAVGKLADEGVVILQSLVIPAPFDGNPVFRALQLILQLQKILVGFERGIILRDCEKPPQRAVQLSVGLELRLRIVRAQ